MNCNQMKQGNSSVCIKIFLIWNTTEKLELVDETIS